MVFMENYYSRICMKYACSKCGYIYEEKNFGLNRLFLCHLPKTWKCPVCGASKDLFHRVKREDAAQELIERQEEEKRIKMVQDELKREEELRQRIDRGRKLQIERMKQEALARRQEEERRRREEERRLKEEQKQRDKRESRLAIAKGLILGELMSRDVRKRIRERDMRMRKNWREDNQK